MQQKIRLLWYNLFEEKRLQERKRHVPVLDYQVGLTGTWTLGLLQYDVGPPAVEGIKESTSVLGRMRGYSEPLVFVNVSTRCDD